MKITTEMIEKMGSYIENLPDGACTTTARVFTKVFPDIAVSLVNMKTVSSMDMFDVNYQVMEWVETRGNVYLDMLEHYNKVEGLPFNLAFYVRHKNASGKFLSHIPICFFQSVLEQKMVKEAVFKIKDDERLYRLGYSESDKRYWIGNSSEKFKKTSELLAIPFVENHSLSEVWQDIELVSLDGLELDEWVTEILKEDE